MATTKAPARKRSTENAGSGFVLGSGSLSELEGVQPDLIRVVERAIEITSQDFTVHSGLRTAEEQAELYRRGASQRDGVHRKSEHQAQADGYGHAVDLVPYVAGRLRWEWPLIYPIATAMRQASQDLCVKLRWGGAWDLPFDSLRPYDMKGEVAAYCRRHPGPDFIDGPHYELA